MDTKYAFIESSVLSFNIFLFFILVLVGLIMMINMCILGTMALKPKKSEIQAIQRLLRDEPSAIEGSSEDNGSLEELGVQPNASV